MKTIEYRELSGHWEDDDYVGISTDELNKLGADGWRVHNSHVSGLHMVKAWLIREVVSVKCATCLVFHKNDTDNSLCTSFRPMVDGALTRGTLIFNEYAEADWMVLDVGRRSVRLVDMVYMRGWCWSMHDDGIRAEISVAASFDGGSEVNENEWLSVPVTKWPPPDAVATYLRSVRP